MDWSNEKILQFIELYQMHPCIWDPKNKSHKNRTCVAEAWNEIKDDLGIPCTVQELKKKKESLMAAYRGYKVKIQRSIALEADGAVYQPTWYAFTLMDSFLGSVFKCNPTLKTANVPRQDITEDSNSGDNEANEFLQERTPAPQSSSQQGYPHRRSIQQGCSQQRSSQHTPSANKRKSHNPPELRETKKKMDEVCAFLKNISQQQHLLDEDDECDLFAKLLAKKLRKLPEERRDRLIFQINQLVYEENLGRRNYNVPHYSGTPTPSPNYITPSVDPLHEFAKEEDSE